MYSILIQTFSQESVRQQL